MSTRPERNPKRRPISVPNYILIGGEHFFPSCAGFLCMSVFVCVSVFTCVSVWMCECVCISINSFIFLDKVLLLTFSFSLLFVSSPCFVLVTFVRCCNYFNTVCVWSANTKAHMQRSLTLTSLFLMVYSCINFLRNEAIFLFSLFACRIWAVIFLIIFFVVRSCLNF